MARLPLILGMTLEGLTLCTHLQKVITEPLPSRPAKSLTFETNNKNTQRQQKLNL